MATKLTATTSSITGLLINSEGMSAIAVTTAP
jgi:hypothetical protein